MTGIIGSLELLDTRIAQGRIKELDRYVNAAQGAAKRAAALTHRLLAFSRRQTLDPKPTDINRLVAGIEELIRRTMGPTIEVETVVRIYSEVGQGMTVCLYMPGHQGASEALHQSAEQSGAPRAEWNATVLIVDDEPTVRMLVAEVLEDLGYTAIEAADGASGLKLLQSATRIDLLVTDVGLPTLPEWRGQT